MQKFSPKNAFDYDIIITNIDSYLRPNYELNNAHSLLNVLNADVIFDGDNEIPMPKVDGGAALLLRPDKWSYQPLRIDDDIFATFLALRRTFEWESRQSKTAMLAPIQHKGLM